MRKCNADAVSRFLDGGLTLPDRRDLELHISTCISCARELEELQRIDRILAEWGSRRFPVSHSAQARMAQAVERRRRPLSIRALSRVVPAALGTSVAAVLVMLSVNLGILVQTRVPAATTAVSGYPTQLARQSRPLIDFRRSSAILFGHAGSQPKQVVERRTQLANIY
jgi:anti-sigma factor RsiW